VKAYKNHPDGKEYITDLYHDGDFIGYSALLENSYYLDSAVALEDLEVLAIPKDDFLQMVYNDISISSKFIHIISKNVKEKEQRLVNMAYSSLRKRVATALVEITSKFNLNDKEMAIEISREEIAQYVGTATESLIRTLSDFKAEKLIEIKNGKVIVNSTEKLKTLLN
jgi:CRP-like cAMP-binding protein